MLSAGLSLVGSRQPEEIADRYLEKQALDAAPIPEETGGSCCATTSRCPTRAGKALDRIGKLCNRGQASISRSRSYQVRNHAAALTALSPKADVIFDASFSPRLDYYTGIVFEMTGADGDVLASGGEYDRLLDRLGATEPITASGCALWIDRLEEEAAAMTDEQTRPSPCPPRAASKNRRARRFRRVAADHRPAGRRALLCRLDQEPAAGDGALLPGRRDRPRTDPRQHRYRRHRLRPHPRGHRERRGERRCSCSRSASARPMSWSPCPTPGSTSPTWSTSPTSRPTSAPAMAAGCASRPSTCT